MGLDVQEELDALKAMTGPELRARYAEVFGEECRSRHKPFLVKRVLWRLQALEEGGLPSRALRQAGLSEGARRRAEELANDADLRLTAPRAKAHARAAAPGRVAPCRDRRLPMPGTVLVRRYKGHTVQVTVLDDGFEYDGTVHRSLSAVAQQVTGSHWNGMLFFGLTRKEAAKA